MNDSEIPVPKESGAILNTTQREVMDTKARLKIKAHNDDIASLRSQISALSALVTVLVSTGDEVLRERVHSVRDQLAKKDPTAARNIDAILASIINRNTPVQ